MKQQKPSASVVVWPPSGESQKVDRGYLWYALLWLRPKIVGSEGAVFASINKKSIESLKIPLPPLEDQRRIVAVLDRAFAALDRAQAHAEANLADAAELERLTSLILSERPTNDNGRWVHHRSGIPITAVPRRWCEPRIIKPKTISAKANVAQPDEYRRLRTARWEDATTLTRAYNPRRAPELLLVKCRGSDLWSRSTLA